MQDAVRVAGWWGRQSAESRTIFCAQNGWREAVWKRDEHGKWYEASATLRSVVRLNWDGSVALGRRRVVRREP